MNASVALGQDLAQFNYGEFVVNGAPYSTNWTQPVSPDIRSVAGQEAGVLLGGDVGLASTWERAYPEMSIAPRDAGMILQNFSIVGAGALATPQPGAAGAAAFDLQGEWPETGQMSFEPVETFAARPADFADPYQRILDARRELSRNPNSAVGLNAFKELQGSGFPQVDFLATVSLAASYETDGPNRDLKLAWSEWNRAADIDAQAVPELIRFENMYSGFQLEPARRQVLLAALANSEHLLAPVAEFEILLAADQSTWTDQIAHWLEGSGFEKRYAGQALQLTGDLEGALSAYNGAIEVPGNRLDLGQSQFRAADLILSNPDRFFDRQRAAVLQLQEAARNGNGDAIAALGVELENHEDRFTALLAARSSGATEPRLATLRETIGSCLIGEDRYSNCQRIQVAFATNREPDGKSFGIEIADRLSMGFSEVVIPGRPDPADRAPGLSGWVNDAAAGLVGWGDRLPEIDKPEFAVVGSSLEEFLDTLKERADAEFDGRALVFVHGYNNDIEIGVQRLADLVAKANEPGLPILFSWPSANSGKMVWESGLPELAYKRDQRIATDSCRSAREFLTAVVSRFGADNVSILGHSMGTFVINSALSDCGGEANLLAQERLEALIFAAPDISRQDFFDKRDWAAGLSGAFNIYMSRQDLALIASDELNKGPRLGQGGSGRFLDDRFVVVDASLLERDGNTNHAYVFDADPARRDLRLVVSRVLEPRDRSCLDADDAEPFYHLYCP